MPKKKFRFGISNIMPNRKFFAQNLKSKKNGRGSSKVVWIDDSIEKEWRLLKTKSGCPTDRLFLNYLLRLAKKDLFNIRPKNASDKSITNNSFKNEEVSISYENSSGCNWRKCFAQHMEKEKKVVKHIHRNQRTEKTKKNVHVSGVRNFSEGIIPTNTNFLEINSTENIKTEDTKDLALININMELREEKESKYCSKKCVTDKIFNDSYSHNSSVTNVPSKEKQCESILTETKITQNDKNVKTSKVREKKVKKFKEQVKSVLKREKVRLRIKDGAAKVENKKEIKRLKFCLTCNFKHAGKCLFIHNNNNNNDDDAYDEGEREDGSDEKEMKTNIDREKGTTSTYFSENIEALNQQFVDNNKFNCEVSEKDTYMSKKGRNSSTKMQGIKPGKELYFLLNGKSKSHKIVTNNTPSDITLKVNDLNFAKSSLPDYLYFKVVNADHGQSVFTKVFLKKSTQFGPLLGQKVKEMDISDDVNMKDIWEVHLLDSISYISTQDTQTSNWLRFLRPADNREIANLLSSVKNNGLYFDAIKDIDVGEELLYWTDDFHLVWSKKKFEKKNCGGCNIQFTHTLYYRKHCMIFHDPNSSLTTRKFYCKICGLAVLGKEKIIKHAAEIHQGKGAYQCQYCLKFFLRLNYLEMHRTYGCSKNPQRSRPLCDLCGKKFCQPQKLKVHIKRMHSDMAQVLRDFQCKNCQKILGSRAALQRHLKEVHKKDVVGAFTCDLCGKIFQNKSNLKIHMLTHSGVKPFKCQELECTAAFTTKQCLQFHYKKAHGLSDDVIPKIERSVAYTFDAYSGGFISHPGGVAPLELKDQQHSIIKQKKDGLNLTLAVTQNSSNGKEETPPPSSEPNAVVQFDEKVASSSEVIEKELESVQEAKNLNSGSEIILDDNFFTEPNQNEKTMVKSNKKFWGSDNVSWDCKNVFKENSSTSLLVEAAINAAEKNIIEKSETEDNKPHSLQRMDKSGVSDTSKLNTLLRINPSPFTETHRDGNGSINLRDKQSDLLTEEGILSSRHRGLVEICKGNDDVNDNCRIEEILRFEKFESFRTNEFNPRLLCTDKLDCRDIDFSIECRSLVNNLEKNRSSDLEIHRLKEEGYEVRGGYERMVEEEGNVEAENLCLKEKPYHYENIDEFVKLGRNSSEFESAFINDMGGPNTIQNFGTSSFRSPNEILPPRSYHSLNVESESVDLSISRSIFSSLDLIPSKVDLSTRHIEFRSHFGLPPPPLQFGRSTSVIDSDSVQIPTSNYGMYHSYGVSGLRPCQTSQFQPYNPLYY